VQSDLLVLRIIQRLEITKQNGVNPFFQIWVESRQINQANNRFNSGVTYDDAGNITIDSKFRKLQFQCDANNRQKESANLDGSSVVVSVYDAGGQRVGTQVGGSLTNVLVYDAGGELVAEYGTPAGTGGTQYLFSDQQGSPRTITNASGAVVSRHDYLPFGEELNAGIGMRTTNQGYSAGDNARQKYAGMENDDATGMSHTLWRQYDSSSGRWTSPDPYTASMTIANPQSFNRYSYVGNDPVNMRDPSGLMTKEGQPDPDAAAATEEPPGDPFETGRSITAEAEGRFDAGVKQAIALRAFNDALSDGNVDGARDIIAANPSIGHEENSSYNPNAQGRVTVQAKIKSKFEPGKVYVCTRHTRVNGVFSIVNGVALHYWLRTDEKEAGLGDLNGDVPGAAAESTYVTWTAIVDHHGQSEEPGTSCEVAPDADPKIVNRLLEIGKPMGRFTLTNNCWQFVNNVLSAADTRPPPRRITFADKE
jgi:RHS repeat-associated protein